MNLKDSHKPFPRTHHPQVYLGGLTCAYERASALDAHPEAQQAALVLLGELGQRCATAHAGFVAGAPAAVARVVRGGIAYALRVRAAHPPVLFMCLAGLRWA